MLNGALATSAVAAISFLQSLSIRSLNGHVASEHTSTRACDACMSWMSKINGGGSATIARKDFSLQLVCYLA